ncbi:ATP-binding protein [Blastomonas aquatica]|uniref:ATP-binding protein n=1 Tax=Blastomonas aquatica TaxID=1510276 RepID=UPI003624405A
MLKNDPNHKFDRHRALTIGALAAILLSLASIYVLMRSEFAGATQLGRTAEQTWQTRSLLAQFQEVQLDAETAVRGYAITGNEAFLEPYLTAAARRDALLAELRLQADQAIVDSLPRLERLSALQFSNAELNARDVREGRAENAQGRIAEGRGKRLMDEIRAEVRALTAIEERRLDALGRASRDTSADIERGLTLLLLAIAVLLALLTLMVSRSARGRLEALAQTERLAARQSAMFDGADDAMLLLDKGGFIIRLNPSVVRIFGHSADDLCGKHNTILMAETVSIEDSQAWLARVGKATIEGAGRKLEFTGRRADGSTFETEIAVSLVEEGGDNQYVAAIRDISLRKRAERMKSEFVSTVSHELRTPLTSIGGSLGLLAGGAVGELNEKAARLVNIAHSNCERLIRLINDILDIEKIESGKMTFDLRKLTIGPLIKRTIEANRQYADDHGVKIEVTLSPWPQCIIGDPDRLEQVLTNLVSNAIKHSPNGETVSLRTEQRGRDVRIEVLDRGSGVPESFRTQIFAKFAMADNSDARTRGGTGLGLAIVREIAERHGGRAGFLDRPGAAVSFMLICRWHRRLPRRPADCRRDCR